MEKYFLKMFKLIQSPQPNLPFNKKCLMLIDLIQQRVAKTSFLSPKILLTKNRKDIEYRIEFLKKIFDKDFSPENTLYYQFISDSGTGGGINGGTDPKKFISLFENIKKNNILEPIIIRKYSKKTIKTRFFLNGKRISKEYSNENGFQIINGAHRLAIAIFLDFEKIPVKIYNSFSFEVPNYTDYIKEKESKYKEKLEME